jgi:prepilin-type N-terminal cleavage/methylation domain-containing protein
VTSPTTTPARRGQDGFTVLEVMIALTILLIGIAGLLSMQLASIRATAFSRHATEASTLAEDKMEALRTVPTTSLVGGNDQVDARGVLDSAGLFKRVWTVTGSGTDNIVSIDVTWEDQGESYTITMATLRTP